MRHKVKNTVLALFCSILFVCAAAFALGVFDMSESKIARAENGTVEYESITVSFVSDIYTSDTTAALIKSRLNVTGSTAEGEQEVIAPEYYSVTVNGMASGWTLQTAYANTIEVSYTNPSGGVLLSLIHI